ncbi:MAG: undecaprenyldiphospho-muramoylpentapeptide beta-N-acetylglucosaminyltransferase [Methylohalobius sp.]|nr:undecaprenyldiphospho-muramoylpentapeptide beta-N-acetylglucosaminyltransferase [Methylohalobius sp.]
MAKVMILAGGTGGHVFPALAVADWLRRHDHRVSWMGTRRGLEARVVSEAGIELDVLDVSGLRGAGLSTKLQAPGMLVKALVQAVGHIRRRRPDVVLGMGGFVAGPGGIAAVGLKVPLVIHEQNRVAGATNRFLARWARRVLEAFPGAFADRFRPCWTGNPLRREIQEAGVKRRSAPALRPVRILVLGGSQGAQPLNEIVPRALSALGSRIDVWHQSGSAMQAQVTAAYHNAAVKARVDAFIVDMAAAYSWADLAICRAGAMTVSELAAIGLGAILVPYPYCRDDHQTHNAKYLAERGAAWLLPQRELTADRLSAAVAELITHPDRLQAMGEAARQAARLDATETVAQICLEEVLR